MQLSLYFSNVCKATKQRVSRPMISLLLGLFITYFIFTQSPYRIDARNIRRIKECGIQTLYQDISDGLFPRSSRIPMCITNKTFDELLDEQNLLSIERERYQWGEPEEFLGFPPSIRNFDDVKCQEDFSLPNAIAFFGNMRKTLWEIFGSSLFASWTSIKSFELIFNSPFMDRPVIMDHWDQDEVFSAERLRGTNPVVLQKIDRIPSNFMIDEARLIGFIDRHASIESEFSKGHFFLESYPELDGVPTKNGVAFPAMCLHYVRDDGVLIPVAIQLTQKLDENNTLGVIYPDEGDAWLFAKLATNMATALHHQVVTHLLKTHLFVEVWSIAAHRSLPENHPMYILMKDFLDKVMAINHQARTLLLPKIIDIVASPGVPGSRYIAQLVYDSYNFTEAYLKNDLIKRGVWNPDLPIDQQPLPNYDFRDFSLPLWDAVEDYVRGIIHTFYADDATVSRDISIQNFAKEISVEGKMRGFPHPIVSMDQLTDVITMIIYTASVQHAAINFIQYDKLGYTPNLPLSMTIEKLPQSKSDITEEFIFNALPGFKKSVLQTAVVWTLSASPIFESEMIIHPTVWNHGDAQAVSEKFVRRLLEISDDVAIKNAVRDPISKYTVLDPKKIPKATSI